MADHFGLVDQYAAVQPPYAPTEVAGIVVPQLGRNLVNTGIFIFAGIMQNDIDKSAHYLGILSMLFAAVVVSQAVLERLRVMASAPTFHRDTLALLLVELLGWVNAYLSGTLVGMLTAVFRNAPSRGHFDALNLVLPLTILVLVVTRLYWLNMIGAPRADINAILTRERSVRDRKDT
jgi:hypothetical protein